MLETREAFPEALKLLESPEIDLIGKIDLEHGLFLLRLSRNNDVYDYRYTERHPHEVCRLLDKTLPMQGLSYHKTELDSIISELEVQLPQGTPCLVGLRERSA